MVRNAIEAQLGSLTVRNVELEVRLQISQAELAEARATIDELRRANKTELD